MKFPFCLVLCIGKFMYQLAFLELLLLLAFVAMFVYCLIRHQWTSLSPRRGAVISFSFYFYFLEDEQPKRKPVAITPLGRDETSDAPRWMHVKTTCLWRDEASKRGVVAPCLSIGIGVGSGSVS